jgi:hypothetical protein
MRGHVGAGRLQVHTGIGWHLSFSSESFEYYCIRQVFWLAFFSVAFPKQNVQWPLCTETFVGMACMLPKGAYSYGDSAGFSPDFPFNRTLGCEPITGQMWDIFLFAGKKIIKPAGKMCKT